MQGFEEYCGKCGKVKGLHNCNISQPSPSKKREDDLPRPTLKKIDKEKLVSLAKKVREDDWEEVLLKRYLEKEGNFTWLELEGIFRALLLRQKRELLVRLTLELKEPHSKDNIDWKAGYLKAMMDLEKRKKDV